LVSHYLNDIPCKNYNYVFAFVKVMPKILLVPFFTDTVYISACRDMNKECMPGRMLFTMYPL